MIRRTSGFVVGARQVALTTGAVVGLICILVMLAGLLFGVRPLVFQSGSMSPTIGTGALAIAHEVDAAELEKGDIVSVPLPSGGRVTHRIVRIDHIDDGKAVLELKGDANEVVDATPHQVQSADVVLFSIPMVGHVLSWLTSPLGFILLGLYAAFLISVLVRRPAGGDDGHGEGALPGRRRGGRRKSRATRRRALRAAAGVPVAVATLAAGLVLQHLTEPTLAAWLDVSTVNGTNQAAYTSPAIPGTNCAVASGGTNTSRGVVLSWPAFAASLPPLDYAENVSVLTSPTVTNPVVTTGNQQLTVKYNPGTAANQSKTVTVTANAHPASSATWLGPTTTWKFKTAANAFTNPTCGEVTPPTATISAPDNTNRTLAAERTFVQTTCTNTTPARFFCGTMSDTSTITSVQYQLLRGTQCWNGTTGWTSTNCATTWQTATMNGATAFYEAGNTGVTLNTVYSTTGSYTLNVRVTDTWDNVTTRTSSFTLS